MVCTKDFSTRTNFIPRKNATTGNAWGVALDIGYSAVKGMAPNNVFCFPSFARKFNGEMLSGIGEASPNDIQYRSENGEVWNVGLMAQDAINSDDSNDSIHSLYGRNRYFSPMFLVLARVGLALCLQKNEYGDPANKPIMLQTGLPPAYLKSDAYYLKDALAGHHSFDVRLGGQKWQHYEFDLPEDNIRVMAQPMGSFFSAALTNEAEQLPSAKKLLSSNLLIFDAGFGTVDVYSIRNRQIESSQSFDDCGMKAVLMGTCDAIQMKYHTEIPVHAMQKYLREGHIKTFDRKLRTSSFKPFDDLLEKSAEKVCDEALDRIEAMYNTLRDYDYLLVTGGTGAAWYDRIVDRYAGMESLKIVTGSQNDTLSHIYSNVRGYYLVQAGKLRKTT